ncbi:Uncharacterized conserved protein YgbK, DUF1537 family [Catalinimonas alkaloidigena]|uniref:Uncharacterized conserved protein YgbK, DUF1537 family n=1 Tax=Catalinimonas alkaloidigena TaxID=1075417 RepID=A0A1G8XBN8_9BACT|nr:four-carbon acid sugar kinase family protein [Catalinimonas alkaloidigena]SDJ87913.1 Uncharacterized conserved protein YgbK, DUF1537 family [Catalinimonas alkaloidigena]
MSERPHNLLLAFYGDDFTGSTDALEFLSRAGAKTALFIEPPTPEQLARYDGLRAIGVAGMTRSLAPAQMEATLRPAFRQLRQLGAPHVHYKVCSTFDSSPTIGSIGRAIDVGADVFQAPFVPLLVAAPPLGRYCAFGNLFARMGIGSTGTIHRLDRHPSMRKHPVTPADESDLRLHLGRQTDKCIGLFDLLHIALPEPEARSALDQLMQQGAEVVLFDAMYASQLAGIGRLIDRYASPQAPLFSVGSSGIEMALGAHWQQAEQLQPQTAWADPGRAEPLLVASGSCSPVTSGQIAWALSQGFREVVLDTAALAARPDDAALLDGYASTITEQVNDGRHVILHTNGGENASATNEIFAQQGLDASALRERTAQLYGTALGTILRNVVARTGVQRLVVAGGDTSSFAARALGIEAVEMIAPLSPGAPLCRAYAPNSPVDGREVNFKGGQVGREDYFGTVLEGKQPALHPTHS